MNRIIDSLSLKNIHNEKLAVVRAILALAALLTFLFNDFDLLTDRRYILNITLMQDKVVMYNYSLFTLFTPIVTKALIILILLLVMSGFLPQVTCFLHVWVTLSITNAMAFIDGGDHIAANLSILLIPLCITDNRINQWRKPIPNKSAINVFANLSLYLIYLQTAILYLHAGTGKIFANAPEWKEGTAAYYWFSHPIFGAPDWLRVVIEQITLSKFVPILTWSIILLEIFLFACILANKRTKTFFLILGTIFHLSIIVVHGLFSFFLSIFPLLIMYLDDENNVVKILNRIRSIKNKSITIRTEKKEELHPVPTFNVSNDSTLDSKS